MRPIKPVASQDFEIPEPGTYLARCYLMSDIGTHQISSQQFGTKNVRQVVIAFELLEDELGEGVKMSDGRPFAISKTYTLSLHKNASLRADLNSWRGKPLTDDEANDFDLTNLLDKFCTVQVVHNISNGKTFANINGIMNTKKTALAVNPIVSYSIEEPDAEMFNKLPAWVQKKIQESAEWVDAEVESNIEVVNDIEGEPVSLEGVPF